MTAKIYALWRALQLCAELNVPVMVFEGDALQVIEAVKKKEECWSWYGQLIEDVKQAMKGNQGWTIQFTKRDGNKAAHCLAKLGLSSEEERVWMEDVPKEMYSTVIHDTHCIDTI